MCEKPRIKPQWKPPLKSVPGRAMAANNEWSRSNTAPELQLARKFTPAPRATNCGNNSRTRELPLCPSKLVTAAAPTIKKTAPVVPQPPPPAVTYNPSRKKSTTTPFSVEHTLARRHGMSTGNSKAFDIHVVDLDESNQSGRPIDKDNMSDVSSILSMSPKRPNH